MKNIYRLLLSLAAVATLTTSCLKDEDDEIQRNPECVITQFSVNDIDSDVTIKLANGKDTTITKTIGGSNISFNINHIKNEIYSVDSLPNWTDLTKVVPRISSTGYVYVKQHNDETFKQFASDSIDFTKPVKFLVIATDGVSTKEYTAQIFKKDGETDSLKWTAVSNADLQLEGTHRTVVLDDRIYVFHEKDGTPLVTSTSFLSEGASWRNPAELTCDKGNVDWNSVIVFGGHLYALNTDGNICRSTNDERGTTWTTVTDRTFQKLLATDGIYIYAADADAIYATDDLQTWRECGKSNLDMLPQTCITSVSYTSRTNPALRNAVMGGLTPQNNDNAVIWYKVSSANTSIDQTWNYIQVTAENNYGCPKLENMSMTYHNGQIFAIGGNNEGIYISEDNGISWHLQTSKKLLPAEVAGHNTPASITAGNGHLWLIQSGGKVWRGKIG